MSIEHSARDITLSHSSYKLIIGLQNELTIILNIILFLIKEKIKSIFCNTNYKKDNRGMHYNQWYHPGECIYEINLIKRENDRNTYQQSIPNINFTQKYIHLIS